MTLVLCSSLLSGQEGGEQEAEHFFESSVRPILVQRCQRCHGAEKAESDFRVDSRKAILQGGASEIPGAVEGKPNESLLMKAVRHEADYDMPPDEPLSEEEIELLARWVEIGLPWPASPGSEVASLSARDRIEKHRNEHWAFQKVERPKIPDLSSGSNSELSQLDRLVLQKLQAKGLDLSPLADKRTLIRRLYFDLTGLPPTYDQVEAFVADGRPDATERLVDELLDSQEYGERWGRHWLDVARYADTRGYALEGVDRNFPFAFTYRDYVIDAFNNDLPYNQFVIEQIAADQLGFAKNDPRLAALGFLTVGRKFLRRTLVVDDQVDVVTRGLLGLTVGCARCHDHKYDAIPTEDYYSLYGVFDSSVEPEELPLIGGRPTDEKGVAFLDELSRKKKSLDDFIRESGGEPKAEFNFEAFGDRLEKSKRNKLKKLRANLSRFHTKTPDGIARAMVIQDAPEPKETFVFIRGNPNRPGKKVAKRFPQVVAAESERATVFERGSGRLELAQRIASKENPLTARVFVNRVWAHHFVRPLVDTPSDFGIQCAEPLQRDVLEYLAFEFMKSNWSVKSLHRLIVNSCVYRQSSANHAKAAEIDPENALLWRMNKRRLEFEALRDSILAATERLNREQRGGKSAELYVAPFDLRRSIYGRINRQHLPGVLRVFDFASPDQTVAMRATNSVPQQGLFLMNSPFVIEQAEEFAKSIEDSSVSDPDVAFVFRKLLSRDPSDAERMSMESYLNNGGDLAGLVHLLIMTNEFAFVD